MLALRVKCSTQHTVWCRGVKTRPGHAFPLRRGWVKASSVFQPLLNQFPFAFPEGAPDWLTCIAYVSNWLRVKTLATPTPQIPFEKLPNKTHTHFMACSWISRDSICPPTRKQLANSSMCTATSSRQACVDRNSNYLHLLWLVELWLVVNCSNEIWVGNQW